MKSEIKDNHAVEMIGVTKIFLDTIIANDNISFKVKKGEIHALVGENGAGKSTLMSILFGLYQPTKGVIKINGKEVVISDSIKAGQLGIGMVHQHFKLVDNFTVTQNIILGTEPAKFQFLNYRKAKEKIKKISDKYKLNVDPNLKIENSTVGMQQRVEILKVLYRGADIIVLDEPTAVLTPQEIEGLLNIVRELKKAGKTIIFISHKLDEVKAIADSVTVIRLGRVIESFAATQRTKEEIAVSMVGREIVEVKNNINVEMGKTLLKVEDLNVKKMNSLNQRRKNSFITKFINEKKVNKMKKDFLDKVIERETEIDNLKEKYNLSLKKNGLSAEQKNKLRIEYENAEAKIKLKYEKKAASKKYFEELNQIKEKYKVNKNKSAVKDLKASYQLEIAKLDKKYKLEVINENSNGSALGLSNFNLEIKAGEIVAIAGVEGNGQSELIYALTGLMKPHKGKVTFLEQDVTGFKANKLYNLGLSHIPEDRHKYALVLDYSVIDNMVLQNIDSFPFSKFGLLRRKSIQNYAQKIIENYDVRGSKNGFAVARGLSGGNQQKAVVGRELIRKHKLLVVAQPTRGLDIGAIEYIHERILEEKKNGNAVLLISYELSEVMALADRIVVLHSGNIIGDVSAKNIARETLGLMMAGQKWQGQMNK